MFPLRVRGREVVRVRAGLGPGDRRRTGTCTLDLSPHRDVAGRTRSTDGRRPGRPAGARAHRGRHAARPRTSTWCPAGATSRARELLERLATRGFGGSWWSRSTPGGRDRSGGAGGRPRRGAGLHPAAPGGARPSRSPLSRDAGRDPSHRCSSAARETTAVEQVVAGAAAVTRSVVQRFVAGEGRGRRGPGDPPAGRGRAAVSLDHLGEDTDRPGAGRAAAAKAYLTILRAGWPTRG